MDKSQSTLFFTGDFCPHLRIEKLAINEDYSPVFNDFKKEFEKNDLNIVDLECPLTERTSQIEKTGPHQKAHPKTIELLKEINVELVAMANNHILDYGSEALLETIDLCKKNGIDTIGVGKNSEEAKQPIVKEINGCKIGFINVAEFEWTIATPTQPGANPLDVIETFNTIQQLKKTVDKIIVIAHGGNEFYHLPSPRIKKTYRFFIDAGANAVISHHTHCYTGYEVYKEAPIFYGLGNFVYDWPGKADDNWNVGYAVRLFVNQQITFEIVPFKQNNGEQVGVHYLTENEKNTFKKRIAKLNTTIADDNALETEFQKLVEKHKGVYQLYFEPYRGKLMSSLRIRKLLPDLFSKKKKMLQLNIIRCESHKDVLVEVMKDSLTKRK